jgi:hypothetical protein
MLAIIGFRSSFLFRLSSATLSRPADNFGAPDNFGDIVNSDDFGDFGDIGGFFAMERPDGVRKILKLSTLDLSTGEVFSLRYLCANF